MTRPHHVVHVITDLEVGGTQLALCRLLRRLDPDRLRSSVVSLTPAGPVAARIKAEGTEVHAVGLRPESPNPRGLLHLRRLLRRLDADLVQTWLYHADLIGGLAARMARRPVVWGVRGTDVRWLGQKRHTAATVRACTLLSRAIPTRVVYNSPSGRSSHEAAGYPSAKGVVIPNGYDLAVLRPDPDARRSVRAELGLASDAPLVGHVGRYDPLKDHAGLLAAIGRVAGDRADVHLVLVGPDVDADNRELVELVGDAGLDGRCSLLGARNDVPRLLSSFDVLVSSSSSEGFPNVVAEAMACAVPCVVTAVGESADVVGDTGVVVPPRDVDALASGIERLLERTHGERADLGAAARSRIEHRYDLGVVARRYEALYDEVLSPNVAAGSGRRVG